MGFHPVLSETLIMISHSTFGSHFEDTEYSDEQIIKELVRKAKNVLLKNLKTGVRKFDGEKYEYLYICPASLKYPHQWLWDSSFHAIVTSKIYPDLAKKEIETLLKAMRFDGFLPNMILWTGPRLFERIATHFFVRGMSSNITQPPVIAISIEEIYKNTKDLDFVRSCLPPVKRYYNWLQKERDPDNDGLISAIHPWETGHDASPAFDQLLGIKETKPKCWKLYLALYGLLFKYSSLGWDTKKIFASKAFDVEYLVSNCIYAQGLRAIARLSKILGVDDDSQIYQERADKVEKAIVNICWNEEKKIFFDVSSPEHKQLQVKTASSLFPIILDNVPPDILDKLINTHLTSEQEFWSPFPVPSVAMDEPSFNPNNSLTLWRGPTWINTNWFLVRGLKKHGYDSIAREIIKKSIVLIDKAGFWEFYHPLTGKGEGQKNLSWSTLVVDMLSYL